MEKAKHTPEPWEVDFGNNCDGSGEEAVVYAVNIGTIAVIPDGLKGWEANARLIAAAPELLEACKQAIALLASYAPKEREALQNFVNVVAKAEAK